MDLDEVRSLSRLLDGYKRQWCFAGGWAVDLHVDRISRPHGDIDILILDRDVSEFVAATTGVLDVYAERPETGKRFDWTPGEPLTPGVEALAAVVDLGRGDTKVQFLVARTDDQDWVYHRGRGTLRLPLDQLACDRHGLPYLAPRIVLLFKSRQMRPKDDADFQAMRDRLTTDEADWLLDRLRRWNPDHPWIDRLR